MYIESLVPGNYYHIYNRGINREAIFKEERNYYSFLNRYEKYCSQVFNTLAYNLLGNHFHIIVQVKKDLVIKSRSGKEIELDPSRQLSHFFNSYAQSFNFLYDRTGGLFESPFHRKCIYDGDYLSTAIFYTHNNAKRHGFVSNLLDWPYSSYHDLLGYHKTFLSRQQVLDWFGGRDQFVNFHLQATVNINDSIWAEV